MEVPIDAAYELSRWLVGRGVDAACEPVPSDLGARLPLVVLRDSGGTRAWPVVDRHRIGVDCYAETVGEAIEAANATLALIDSMNDTHPTVGGVQVYQTAFGGLPQPQTDPEHPDVPMATFLAELTTRARHED